jgi:hypothetical protein
VSDREVNGEDGWVDSNSAVNSKLIRNGYSVGGYIDNLKPKYVLYLVSDGGFKRVHEFDSIEELNLMVKLLLDEGT